VSTDILARNNVRVISRTSSAATIVFAHGFGCDQRMWRFVQPSFERDYRCVLFDHVGSGRSELAAYDRRKYGTLDGYAADVLEVLDAVHAERVIYVGHSVGASIGVLASLLAPERFERLVLVAPSPRFLDDPPDYHGGFTMSDLTGMLDLMERSVVNWAQALAPMAMQNPERPELREELIASFCAGDPSIGRRFAEVVFLSDIRPVLSRVSVPSLIIQSRDDALTPVETGRAMHAMLPGSTFTIIDSAGHLPHMSHPELTEAAIRTYLR
jgi:sigma-B regulation protein RsbQ